MIITISTLLILFSRCSTSNITINSPCHSSHQRFQNDIALPTSSRRKRGATYLQDLLWPNGLIPYSISRSFKSDIYRNIKAAIKIWESHTCLQFVPLTNETYGLTFEPQSCGCCSFVGRQQFGNKKPQEISINGQDCEDVGHMLHEIGHAIGFWHEHVRPDRDKFVKLKSENIDRSSVHNFERKNISEINSLGEKYDYDSIMHYSLRSFSINKDSKTLVPKRKYHPIGQREQLSIGDIRQANKLYSCKKDADQCSRNNGGCDHYCIDLHKGYQCECRKGYILDSDGKTCLLFCNGQWFEQSEGLIFSPNYPMQYPKDASCSWEIRAPTGYFIKLRILKFGLEESPSCKFDAITLKRWVKNSWEGVALFCGKQYQRKIVVKSSFLRIFFRSDGSVQEMGFKIFYQFVPSPCMRRPMSCHTLPVVNQQYYFPTPPLIKCDNEYTSTSGTISVPPSPSNCINKISLRRNRKIVLIITRLISVLTPNCQGEFVKVQSKTEAMKTLCGDMKNQVVYTNSNTVVISNLLNSKDSVLKIDYFSL